MSRKLLVVGLDGASPELIEAWSSAGYLPNIRALIQRGLFARLGSTVPWWSPPAWATFLTGVNPGAHGIYGFERPRPGDPRRRSFSFGGLIRQPTLFELASEAGVTVACLNVPMSFPPRPVRGLWVSGVDTPSLKSPFTYPRQAAETLRRLEPRYLLDIRSFGVGASGRSRQRLIGDAHRMTEAHRQAALYALRDFQPDLLCTVFTATDRVAHYFWRFMTDAHPLREETVQPRFGRAVLEVYQACDAAVGDLVQAMGEPSVLLLSDHGFGPNRWLFHLASWLRAEGYLEVRGNAQELGLRSLRRLADWGLRRARATLPYSAKDWLRERARPLQGAVNAFVAWGEIDWERTRVYPAEFPEGLRVNMAGREPEGIVRPEEAPALLEQLAEKLCRLTGAEGEPLLTRVNRREELYRGGRVGEAPDLILEPSDTGLSLETGRFDVPPEDLLQPVSDRNGYCGIHRRHGTLVAAGPAFARFDSTEPRMLDVAPTILAALGLEPPEWMEGSVLLGAGVGARQKLPVPPSARAEGPAYTPGEERAIERRLRGLGYVD